MNFLAHLHLSRHDDQLMLGNFIADAVKGSDWKYYEERVAEGILMHRKIDDFTDRHPVFSESVSLLRTHFGKFSGVVADIYYDHFLARHFLSHSEVSLVEFTSRVHLLLNASEHIMPPRSRLFLAYMRSKNIPLPYAELDGIHHVFLGMSRRARVPNNMQEGREILERYYNRLQDQFNRFYPDAVSAFAK